MIIQNLFCHLLQHEGLVPKLSFILRPQLKRLLKNFGQQYILAGSTGPIFQAENFLVDWLVTTANGGLSLNVSLDDIKLTLVLNFTESLLVWNMALNACLYTVSMPIVDAASVRFDSAG